MTYHLQDCAIWLGNMHDTQSRIYFKLSVCSYLLTSIAPCMCVHMKVCKILCMYVAYLCLVNTCISYVCVPANWYCTYLFAFRCVCVCLCDCVLWVSSFSVSDLQWWCEEQTAGRAAILVIIYEREGKRRGRDGGRCRRIKKRRRTDSGTATGRIWW